MTWFGFVRYYEDEMRKVAAKGVSKTKTGDIVNTGLPLFNPGIGIGPEVLEEMAAKGRLYGVFHDRTFLPFELSSTEPLTPAVLSRRYQNVIEGMMRHYNTFKSIGQYWEKLNCARFKRIYGEHAIQSIVTAEMGNLFVRFKNLLHFAPPKDITVGALTQKGILTTFMNIAWAWKKDYEYTGCYEDEYWKIWEKRRKADLDKDALLAILDANLNCLWNDEGKEYNNEEKQTEGEVGEGSIDHLTEYANKVEKQLKIGEEIKKAEAALDKTETEIPLPNIEDYYYTNHRDSSKGMPKLKDEMGLVITSNEAAYNVLSNPPPLNLCREVKEKDSRGYFSALSPSEGGVFIHEKRCDSLIEAMYAFHPWLHKDIYSFVTDSASTMNPFLPMSRTTPDGMLVRSPDHLMKLRGLLVKKVKEGMITAENFKEPLEKFFTTPEELEIVKLGAPVYIHEWKSVQQTQNQSNTTEQNYRAFISQEIIDNFMAVVRGQASHSEIHKKAIKILHNALVISNKMDGVAYANLADLPIEEKVGMLVGKGNKEKIKRQKKRMAAYQMKLKGSGVTTLANSFMPIIRRSAIEVANEEMDGTDEIYENGEIEQREPDALELNDDIVCKNPTK